MTPEEDARELRRLMLQSVAELDKGLDLAARLIRGGQARGAVHTLETARAVVRMQDDLVQRFLRMTR